MSSKFIPHRAGRANVWELVTKQFPGLKEIFREMVSNAIDAGSHRFDIDIGKAFKDEISGEDWGKGIENADHFAEYSSGEKEDRVEDPNTIGRIGIGKLSTLRFKIAPDMPLQKALDANPYVTFLTYFPGADMSSRIQMHLDGHHVQSHGGKHFLEHAGTKIIIEKPITMPDPDEIKKYLASTFAIRIAEGMKIFVNGEQLKARMPKGFDAKGRHIRTVSGGHAITGNLYEDQTGNGELLVFTKKVRVCKLLVDDTRAVAGWVNCDGLSLQLNRNDFVTEDRVYKEFMSQMREEVARKFPLKSTSQDKDQHVTTRDYNLAREILDHIGAWMKEKNIEAKMKMFLSATQGQQDTGVDNCGKKLVEAEGSLGKPHTHHGEHHGTGDGKHNPMQQDSYKGKVHILVDEKGKTTKRRLKNDMGIQGKHIALGKDKDPIFYWHPGIIVFNISNDLYRYCVDEKLDKWKIGLRKIRMLPWLSSVMVDMQPEYVSGKMTVAEYKKQRDEASRFLLKTWGYLPRVPESLKAKSEEEVLQEIKQEG